MKLWSLLRAIRGNSNTQSENCTHIFSYEVQREVGKTLKGLLWFLQDELKLFGSCIFEGTFDTNCTGDVFC